MANQSLSSYPGSQNTDSTTAYGVPIPAPPPPVSTQVPLGGIVPAPRVPLSGFTGTGGRIANLGANFLAGVAKGHQISAARKYQQEVHGLNATESLMASSKAAMDRLAATAPAYPVKGDPQYAAKQQAYQQWWGQNGKQLQQLYQANAKARQDYIDYVGQYISPAKGAKGGKSSKKQDEGLMNMLVGHIKRAFVAQPPPLLSPEQYQTLEQLESAKTGVTNWKNPITSSQSQKELAAGMGTMGQNVTQSPEVAAARTANQETQEHAQLMSQQLDQAILNTKTMALSLKAERAALTHTRWSNDPKIINGHIVMTGVKPNGEPVKKDFGPVVSTPDLDTALNGLPPDIQAKAQLIAGSVGIKEALAYVAKYSLLMTTRATSVDIKKMSLANTKQALAIRAANTKAAQDHAEQNAQKLVDYKDAHPAPAKSQFSITQTTSKPSGLLSHFEGPTAKTEERITRVPKPGEEGTPAAPSSPAAPPVRNQFSVSKYIKQNPTATPQQLEAIKAEAQRNGYVVVQ